MISFGNDNLGQRRIWTPPITPHLVGKSMSSWNTPRFSRGLWSSLMAMDRPEAPWPSPIRSRSCHYSRNETWLIRGPWDASRLVFRRTMAIKNKEMDIISEALKDRRCIRREAKIVNENRTLPIYLYQKEHDCIILLYSLCYVLSKFCSWISKGVRQAGVT